MSAPAPVAAAPAKKKSKLLVLGVPLIVLLAAGGGGAWWYFGQQASAAEPEAPPPPATPGIVKFEPFLVNLADQGGRRFLRVSLQLLVVGEHEALELQENELEVSRVRSAILELLTLQSAAQISTAEGRATLKKAIAETVKHAHEHTEVSDVLFAEFVIQ